MELKTLKLSDIKRNSDYLRIETNVETLKKSIENIGLINPLTVNQHNELLAGARRFQALSELQWTETPVHVVDRDLLAQELISIDENLVRSPLNKLELEQCLNRGRVLYEELNPTATKVELSNAVLNSDSKQKAKETLDTNSFVAVTAEKTGLSKSVIKSAIKRDALASDAVKKARELGKLNATQTNEIITLDKAAQEKVLPLIADKTVKEVKTIIRAAQEGGVAAALKENEQLIPLPKAYAAIKSPLKRINKHLAQILQDQVHYEGTEQQQINSEMLALKVHLEHYFQMMDVTQAEQNNETSRMD
ncbi:MAG: ParB N-terminal domain-containing protein [Cocleimonas sp.]|nr:ParB N-terminal domain-containing protein [Cocleimonas sp.]